MRIRLGELSEADMARAVVTELQRQGYETYEEVSTGYGGRRADIVAVRKPIVMIVECKVSLSLKLLDQLSMWHGEANYTIGAVAAGRIGVAAKRYLRSQGLGLWKLVADEIHEEVAPRLHRHCRDRISDSLRPEQRSGEYAQAGSNGGGYWTPFRATCRDLCEAVKRNPGIKLRDALLQIDHHYATTKSAMSALPALIQKGVVAGVRLDKGGLYPAETRDAS